MSEGELTGQEGRTAPTEEEALLERLRPYLPTHLLERLWDAGQEARGERREVAILFADLAGSTALGRSLGPERVRSITDELLSLMVQAVLRYGGTVARLQGDGLLAFFGAPTAHEDDPARAVAAGLEMQGRMSTYGRELKEAYGIAVGLRVGIHHGPVIVGEVGGPLRLEYTALGSVINEASRLEGAARPGTVLVSESVHRLTKPFFEWTARKGLRLKGLPEPVMAYVALRLLHSPSRLRGLEGLEAPLVGRDELLLELAGALQALQQGRGAILAIIGEAGLGKSRLAEELRRMAGEAVTWLEGRCHSFAGDLAYWPYRDALRGWLGVVEGDPAARHRVELRIRLDEVYGPRAPEAYPYLAHLLGLPLEEMGSLAGRGPETLKRETQARVVELMEKLAARRPVVLAIDDLHWADPSSLELTELLLDLADRASLLVCLLSRPERDHDGWRLLTRAADQFPHRYRRLDLQPLSPQAASRLVAHLLEGESLPGPLLQRILERTDGNPFFLEETVRDLIESGALVPRDGRWRVQADVTGLQVPSTVQAVLQARMDRLAGLPRQALQAAAVVGRTFPYRAVAAAVQANGELSPAFTELQRVGLVLEVRRLPEVEYQFKHVLTQQVAYGSILEDERRELHRRVAGALETLGGSEAATIGYHYEQGQDWSPALQWLSRAAAEAQAQLAVAEAVALYRRALACWQRAPGDGASEFQLRFNLGQCLVLSGADPATAEGELLASLELAPDDQARGEVHFRLGQMLHIFTALDLGRAEDHYRRALALLGEGARLYGTVLAHLGYLHRYQRQPGRSAETLIQALQLGEERRDQELAARALIFLSGAYLDLGRLDEAKQAGERGRRLAEDLQHLELIGMAHSFLTDVYLLRLETGEGGPEEARPHIEGVERFGRIYGIKVLEAFAQWGWGYYWALTGDRARAKDALGQAGRMFRDLGSHRRAASCAAAQAGLHLADGEDAAVEAAFDQVRRDLGPAQEAWADVLIARAYAGADREAPAYEHLRRAFQRAPSAEERRHWAEMIRQRPDWKKVRAAPRLLALVEEAMGR